MAVSVKCPGCGKKYSVNAAPGKRLKCKACEATITVPDPDDEFGELDLDDIAEPAVPLPRPARSRKTPGRGASGKSSGKSAGVPWKIIVPAGIVGGLVVLGLLLAPVIQAAAGRMKLKLAEEAVFTTIASCLAVVNSATDATMAQNLAQQYSDLQIQLKSRLEAVKAARAASGLSEAELAARAVEFERQFKPRYHEWGQAELKGNATVFLELRRLCDAPTRFAITDLYQELCPEAGAQAQASREKRDEFMANVERRHAEAAQGQPHLGPGGPGLPGLPPGFTNSPPGAPPNLPPGGFGTPTADTPDADTPESEVPEDEIPPSDFPAKHGAGVVVINILGIDGYNRQLLEKIAPQLSQKLQAEAMEFKVVTRGRCTVFAKVADFSVTARLADFGKITKTFPDRQLVLLQIDLSKF